MGKHHSSFIIECARGRSFTMENNEHQNELKGATNPIQDKSREQEGKAVQDMQQAQDKAKAKTYEL